MNKDVQINSNIDPKSEGKSSRLKNYFLGTLYNFISSLQIMQVKLKDLVKTNYELGLYHMERGNYQDAIFRFKMVLMMHKDHVLALFNLGCCYYAQGKIPEATNAFVRASELQNDIPNLDFWLARTKGNIVPKQIPIGEIKKFFNENAEYYYDSYVVKFGYIGYEKLIENIIPSLSNMNVPLDILDLGCGIGLCGQYLRSQELHINQITGVDISHEMLFQARHLYDKNNDPVYSETKEADYREYLNDRNLNNGKHFHLVVASSSVHYTQDLEQLFHDVKNILNPGGIFAFSFEIAENGNIALGKNKLHYAFSEEYVRQYSKDLDFKLVTFKETMIDKNTKAIACYMTKN